MLFGLSNNPWNFERETIYPKRKCNQIADAAMKLVQTRVTFKAREQ